MKKREIHIFRWIVFLFFLFFISSAFAQLNTDTLLNPGNPLIVLTTDKKELFGISGGVRDTIFILKKGTRDSVMIPLSSIKKLYLADENNFLRGKFVQPDSMYMFNPTFCTAFPLPPKSSWLRSYYFSAIAFHQSIGRRATISYYTSVAAIPAAINFRYSLKLSEHLCIAPEGGLLSASWVAPRIWMWITGARASQGGTLKNVTIGAGYAVVKGFDEYVPTMKRKYAVTYINFGVKQRLSKRFSVAGDFWYIHKPSIYLTGIFVKYHRNSRWQYSVGCMYFSFHVLQKRVNFPAPMLQWNWKL